MDKNIYAAIAMALYEYQGNNVHDKEPGIITIKPNIIDTFITEMDKWNFEPDFLTQI